MGDFTSYNGISRNNIARLNANGSIDSTFNPGIGTNNWVGTSDIQSDGKILIGGGFTTFNGISRNSIARLNANGYLDETFNPGLGANDWVGTSAIQSDGKIIIGGEFTSYNGTARNRIARLNTDGSIDTSFIPILGPNATVQTICIQNDGKIIIGGNFTSYNGASRNRIARLNANGSIDSTFNPGFGANGTVLIISYSKCMEKSSLGGLGTLDGISRSCIARFNANGSPDETFNTGIGANNTIWVANIQSDGKILIGGGFTTFNGISRNRIARLNPDGSLDET
ncbi:MAG: delta-60 repeat domain-containing protein [Saprospiraceae bacterium]|nr:delta-60 repeat domain-containing protein [Saprospiraceae bacterium]